MSFMFSGSIKAEDWFVSHNGREAPCGSRITNACRSLTEVLNNANDGDIINIEGSVPDPDDANGTKLYSLCYDNFLRKPVSLVGYNGKPRIGCHESIDRGIIAIIRQSNFDDTTLTFQSLQLESGTIDITNCSLNIIDVTVIDIYIATILPCTAIAVNIDRTTVFGRFRNESYQPSLGTVPLPMHFTDTWEFHCEITDLNITDSQFFQTKIDVISYNDMNIFVSGSLFSNVPETYDHMGGLKVKCNHTSMTVLIKDTVFEKQRETTRLSSLLNFYDSALFLNMRQYIYRPTDAPSTNASVIIENVQFLNNERGLFLGGFYNKIVIQNCTFTGNIAKHAGPGIYIVSKNFNEVLINDCTFLNNHGGKVRHNYRFLYPNTTVNYKGDLVHFNSSFGRGAMGLVGKGGAISLRSGNARIENSTFINNTASIGGGSVYAYHDTRLTLDRVYMESGPDSEPSEKANILYSKCKEIEVNNLQIMAGTSNRGRSIWEHQGNHWSLGMGTIWVQCPPGYDLRIENSSSYALSRNEIKIAHIYNHLSYFCESCAGNTYSKDFGYLDYVLSCKAVFHHVITFGDKKLPNDSDHKLYVDHHKIECVDCPYGGVCQGVIGSAPMFWGYRQQNSSELLFQHCPPGYCCSSADCEGYNTCMSHRKGRLCGRCSNGYSDAIFWTGCVLNAQCSPGWVFPLLMGIAIIYSVVLLFAQDMKNLIGLIPLELVALFQDKMKKSYFGRSAAILTELKENSETIHEEQVEETLKASPEKQLPPSAYFVMVFFYVQDAFLLCNNPESYGETSAPGFATVKSLIQALFTFQLQFPFAKEVCAFSDTTPISKVFVQLFCPLLVIWGFAAVYCILKLINIRKNNNNTSDDDNRLDKKFATAFVLAVLIFYQLLSLSVFKLLKCLPVGIQSVLYIDGTVTCLQGWQYGILFHALSGILPLCVVFLLGPSLMVKGLIQPWQFVLACFLPFPCIIWWLLQSHGSKSRFANAFAQLSYEMKAVLANLQGPFKEDSNLSWFGVLLIFRLLLVLIKTFILDSIIQQTAMLFICLATLITHCLVKPYKYNSSNFFAIFFTLSLLILACLNPVHTVFQQNGIEPNGPIFYFIQILFSIEASLVVWFPFTIVLIGLLLFVVNVSVLLIRLIQHRVSIK